VKCRRGKKTCEMESKTKVTHNIMHTPDGYLVAVKRNNNGDDQRLTKQENGALSRCFCVVSDC
jgi:hypothetical protein